MCVRICLVCAPIIMCTFKCVVWCIMWVHFCLPCARLRVLCCCIMCVMYVCVHVCLPCAFQSNVFLEWDLRSYSQLNSLGLCATLHLYLSYNQNKSWTLNFTQMRIWKRISRNVNSAHPQHSFFCCLILAASSFFCKHSKHAVSADDTSFF